MTNIPMPAAALEAGARAIYLTFTEVNIGDGEDHWERLLPQYRAEYRAQARAAFLAMLTAWPGMEQDQLFHGFTDGTHYFQPRLILPLTTEASDE